MLNRLPDARESAAIQAIARGTHREHFDEFLKYLADVAGDMVWASAAMDGPDMLRRQGGARTLQHLGEVLRKTADGT